MACYTCYAATCDNVLRTACLYRWKDAAEPVDNRYRDTAHIWSCREVRTSSRNRQTFCVSFHRNGDSIAGLSHMGRWMAVYLG